MSLFGTANRTTISLLDTVTRTTEGASRAIDTALNGVEMLHIKSSDYLADIKAKSEATNKVRPKRIADEITLEHIRSKRDLERELQSLGVTEDEWNSELAEVKALLGA